MPSIDRRHLGTFVQGIAGIVTFVTRWAKGSPLEADRFNWEKAPTPGEVRNRGDPGIPAGGRHGRD